MTGFDRPERESSNREVEEDATIEHAVSKGGTIYFQEEQQKLTGLLIKRVRELTKTVDEHGQATETLQQRTNDLTGSIRSMTRWLVIFTVVVGVLTVVMAWPTIMSGWSCLRSR